MSPSLRARRLETIKFLTQDETRRLFAVIRDKRDRALFLLGVFDLNREKSILPG
jgi:hypothetical protein